MMQILERERRYTVLAPHILKGEFFFFKAVAGSRVAYSYGTCLKALNILVNLLKNVPKFLVVDEYL